ncbi:hypothetical protein BC829DRAFT_194925 [Chytridium lagenaria]|nr:hypothetical protein BC829DRAFT_194925 [Chytridium lagenaria]
MEQAVQAAAIETMTPASIRKNPNPRTLSSFQKRPSNTSFLNQDSCAEEDKMMTADYSVGMDGTCAELESGGGVERARRISQNSAQISPRSRTASMSMQPSRVNGPTGAMLSGIASIPNVAVDDMTCFESWRRYGWMLDRLHLKVGERIRVLTIQ